MLLHPTGFHQLLVDQFSKGPTFIRETVPVTVAPTLVLTVDRRKANAVGFGEVFLTFHTFPRDCDSQSDLIFLQFPREADCSMVTPGHTIDNISSREECQQMCTDGRFHW